MLPLSAPSKLSALLMTRDPIELNQWHHVAFTYDGSRYTDGVKIYVDGVERALQVNLDQINQNFAVKEPLRIGGGAGPEMRFRGSIGDVRV